VRRWQQIALRVAYWAAVLVVSVAILVGLILLIESRDKSAVDDGGFAAPLATPGAPR
jgi:hypothetical protein